MDLNHILILKSRHYLFVERGVYESLNKAWKSTCRVLFGGEIGELREYEEWLGEFLPVFGKRDSHVSGRQVSLVKDDYCKGAKFVSMEEAAGKAAEPLSINEIKDIDSVFEAIRGKWEYAGNKVLGSSMFVESSDNVKDSQYVMNSASIEKSSYIFSSFHCSNSKYLFGAIRVGNGEFQVMGLRGFGTRTFNHYWCLDNSDLYSCACCNGCSEIMFCFNQKNKRRRIGNLQLEKEKYAALKAKLVGEIRDELKKNKRFPPIFELVPNEEPGGEAIALMGRATLRGEGDAKPIDAAFRSAFRVVFKKEAEGIGPYEGWLQRDVPKVREIITGSGSKAYALQPDYYKIYKKLPMKRMVTMEEAGELEGLALGEGDITGIEKIKRGLGAIAYISDEFFAGEYANCIQCLGGTNIFHIYKSDGAKNTEYAALSSFPVDSKYVFGCDRAVGSQFCIKCHYSVDSARCFELDSCEKCSDSYFAHNCEGLSSSMFCFNTKGKRNAVGNLQLAAADYAKIKEMLVGQMADEILKRKGLKWDIYNIGCGRLE